ncbi:pkb-activating kinase-like protein [Myotisia sp. PD_48]|nr:pkb-activating kinase-like protein [Myotisia sp. PD_48]
MEGDLSLSQSLGGLRIANPDDVDVGNISSPPEPETQISPIPSHHRLSTSTPTPTTSTRDQPPPSLTLQSASMPHGLNHHRQIANAARPSSAYFTHPPANSHSSSSPPVTRGGSYRIRTEPSSSTTSTSPSLSDSRGGSAALQAGVAARDSVHTDRTYNGSKSSSSQGYYAAGPLPPRRSSRKMQDRGASQLSGSPYSSENGPLQSSEEWQDRGAAIGVQQGIDANGKPVSRYVKKGVRDFSYGRVLGEGSYSTVVAATDRQTSKEYAIKILDKRHIIKEKKVKYVNIEKDTLNRLTDHPGVVRLYYTFQDERSLYFVLDLASGGELLGVLKRMRSFNEECTRFYGAQILDTIGYMHRRGVIHRDLKPENVLLDASMHIKITDFGTAKMLNLPSQTDINDPDGMPSMVSSEEDRANSFVGTAEYVSPELLTNKSACKASDLWAFGCIIFQLLTGRPPFKASNEYQTFQKIVGLEYEFPIGFPAPARDLVERLLVHDPARRLQIEHIKNHEFFDGIVWGKELWKQKPPRLEPYVPPPAEPIKLNGTSERESFPPNINMNPNAAPFASNNTPNRPYPRLVTELPPPSQLDIEWSPVLTLANERILKLGNLTVSSSSRSRSHNRNGTVGENDSPKKFSRFFGGATTKKRHRLVLVTSGGRVILVPAGGEDKRSKMDISLIHPGTNYRSTTDAKGHSSLVIDTHEKHFVFDEAKNASNDSGSSAVSAQEWVDALDCAKEMASMHSIPDSATGDSRFRDLSSDVSSHANTLSHSDELPANQRTTLTKNQNNDSDSISVKAKKRFSRRHSKNGLSAVF